MVVLFFNVIDSCSIWNVITSPTLYNASLEAGCFYSCSDYVNYECLYKKRIKNESPHRRTKLLEEMSRDRIKVCSLTIDDLQDIELLQNRKKLGMGELSSIALAKKTSQAFLTDDRKARTLGEEILGPERVQTTPKLAGSLFYHRYLLDSDFQKILNEHKASLSGKWGDLSEFFTITYMESMRRKLLDNKVNISGI